MSQEILKGVRDYLKRAMDLYKPIQQTDDKLMKEIHQAHARAMSLVQSVAQKEAKRKKKNDKLSKNGVKRCLHTGRPTKDCPCCQGSKTPMTLRGKGNTTILLNVKAKDRRRKGEVIEGESLTNVHVEIAPKLVRLFGRTGPSSHFNLEFGLEDLVDVEVGGHLYTAPITKISDKALTVDLGDEDEPNLKRVHYFDFARLNT